MVSSLLNSTQTSQELWKLEEKAFCVLQ